MKEEIIGTILVLLFDLIIGSFIYVCTKFTVPTIAAIITVTLGCVAAGATFRVCRYGILKLQEKWSTKKE